MAGLAEANNINVIEMSFDENGLLLKTSQEVDPGEMYAAFRENNHIDVIERYVINTQIFFETVQGSCRSLTDHSKTHGSRGDQSTTIPATHEALLQKHRHGR